MLDVFLSSSSFSINISGILIPTNIPFSFPKDENGIQRNFVKYSFCTSKDILFKFPHNIFSKLSKISFGIIPFNKLLSTITTGILVIGSFTKFPVSIIALVSTVFSFIFIFMLQYISFDINLFLIIFIDILTIINAKIAPKIITLNTSSPVYTPFFIDIFSEFKLFIKFNATPPKINDVK